MDDIQLMKEKSINDYISTLTLNENEIDIDQIKDDLGKVLGEKPGIELNYEVEHLVQEAGKKPIRKEKLESVSVYYSYEDSEGNMRFRTVKYLAD
jgi:hypothetical protein